MSDNALFNDAMARAPDNIAAAVMPLGLAPAALGPFIGALMAHDDAALFQIRGVTPQMAGAGGVALLGTFTTAFRHVWIAAACFVALAALRTFLRSFMRPFSLLYIS